MTIAADRTALRTHFVTGWGTTSPVIYENQPVTDIDMTTAYVRFGIQSADTVRETFGQNGINARHGMVWLQVIVPLGDATATAYALADQFAALFRNFRASGIDLLCTTETIRNVPQKDYYQLNVTVPYLSFG